MSKKAYVGINGISREVGKMYVGVDGVARKVVKGYVGVNGQPKLFWDDSIFTFDIEIATSMRDIQADNILDVSVSASLG